MAVSRWPSGKIIITENRVRVGFESANVPLFVGRHCCPTEKSRRREEWLSELFSFRRAGAAVLLQALNFKLKLSKNLGADDSPVLSSPTDSLASATNQRNTLSQ